MEEIFNSKKDYMKQFSHTWYKNTNLDKSIEYNLWINDIIPITLIVKSTTRYIILSGYPNFIFYKPFRNLLEQYKI